MTESHAKLITVTTASKPFDNDYCKLTNLAWYNRKPMCITFYIKNYLNTI